MHDLARLVFQRVHTFHFFRFGGEHVIEARRLLAIVEETGEAMHTRPNRGEVCLDWARTGRLQRWRESQPTLWAPARLSR
jgi:hypothetical protein